jgi:hypothetical protein
LKFLLCCRCCQALLRLFSFLYFWTQSPSAPSPLSTSFDAQNSPLQGLSTRARPETITAGYQCPTAEMSKTTCDLGSARVGVALLCLTAQTARERPTRGHPRSAVLTQMLSHDVRGDRPPSLGREGLMPPAAVRFEAIRCFRQQALWTPSVFLHPIRLGALLALLPRLPPAL